MYKVFFNDRNVDIVENIGNIVADQYDLIYRYKHRDDLIIILRFFEKATYANKILIYGPKPKEIKKAIISCYRVIKAAGGIVKNQGGKILFIFRRNRWDLPKGKLDRGESYEEGALREVSEECGINNLFIVKKLKPTYHVYRLNGKPVIKKTIWFEMRHSGNEMLMPEHKEDITHAQWIDKHEIDEVLDNTYESIKQALTKAKLI